jgi:hypothetical protein
MVPLGLSPLPVSGPEGETQQPASAAWKDFVTDEAVYRVLTGGSTSRLPVEMDELALSSSEDDFVGTMVVGTAAASALRFVPPIEWPEVEAGALPTRSFSRAKPPEMHELESPRRLASGLGHRWWIPGLAGVAATLMFVGVLFSISNGPAPATGLLEIPKPTPLKPLRGAEPTPIIPKERPAVVSTSLLAP